MLLDFEVAKGGSEKRTKSATAAISFQEEFAMQYDGRKERLRQILCAVSRMA